MVEDKGQPLSDFPQSPSKSLQDSNSIPQTGVMSDSSPTLPPSHLITMTTQCIFIAWHSDDLAPPRGTQLVSIKSLLFGASER